MRKLQKDARQQRSEIEKKPKEPRVPFEPIPLHVPLNAPEQRPVERLEESISSPRGVVIIDYGE